MFKKRYVRPTDTPLESERIIIYNPYKFITPLNKRFRYVLDHLKTAKNTRFYWFVFLITLLRFILNPFVILINEVKFGVIQKKSRVN